MDADTPRRPNLFLIGAPKCGTTSLAWALGEHPAVFFSDPKEPFFWNTDYPELRRREHMTSLDDYLALFDAAEAHHTVIAEGSTTYLSSSEAIPSIIEFEPDAKFVAIVRHPIEAARSFHGELLYTGNETVEDFEQAWRLQERRAAGHDIPDTCRNPAWLQYRDMVTFTPQVRRLVDATGPGHRHVVIYDDLVADPRATYLDVLAFAGLDDDGRETLPRLKGSRRPRFDRVHQLLRNPPAVVDRPALALRRFAARRNDGPIGLVKRAFVTTQDRQPLSEEFAEDLRRTIAPDVGALGELLDRDLDHWASAPSSSGSNGTR